MKQRSFLVNMRGRWADYYWTTVEFTIKKAAAVFADEGIRENIR